MYSTFKNSVKITSKFCWLGSVICSSSEVLCWIWSVTHLNMNMRRDSRINPLHWEHATNPLPFLQSPRVTVRLNIEQTEAETSSAHVNAIIDGIAVTIWSGSAVDLHIKRSINCGSITTQNVKTQVFSFPSAAQTHLIRIVHTKPNISFFFCPGSLKILASAYIFAKCKICCTRYVLLNVSYGISTREHCGHFCKSETPYLGSV